MTIPSLKRPTLEEVQKSLGYIKRIKFDTSPTDAVEVEFANLLQEKEEYIRSEEYASRRKGLTLLGFQHAKWIEEHQDEIPELTELKKQGVLCIDFPGIVVVLEGGDQNFTCLNQNGERWCLGWGLFVSGLRRYGRVARSRQVAKPSEPMNLAPETDPQTLARIALALESIAETLKKSVIKKKK